MATVERPPVALCTPVPEQRITLHGVDWATYQHLVEIIGDRPIRKAFNRGVLELMSPGMPREVFKSLLGRIVVTISDELEIPRKSLGSTTWDRPEVERGIEADECYILTENKIDDMSICRPQSAADCPVPDLAIEIDMRRSEVDRAEIYATLGVAEVWRFDGKTLRIDRLGPAGTYEVASESLFLPITPDEVARWILIENTIDESAWNRRLRAWVREELANRPRPV